MKKLAMGRRCFSSRNMAIIPCSILLSFSVVAVQVGGQFSDGLGFISLDCGYGLDAQAYYVGPLSGIRYVSDAPYIDSGETHNISSVYASVTLPQRFLTVRSFPSGARNCYTFKSMTPRLKYLIRASFLYGNYDSKNSPSVQFDLHLGVNFWKTITVTNRSKVYYTETIMEATTDLISVCLVNNGRGTPFISSLELRPLNRTLYPVVNPSLSLILSSRFDMGRIGDYVRFPSDPHDRIWNPFDETTSLTKTSTNLTVENPVDDHFEAPHVVMKTAVVPVNSTKLELSLATEPGGLDEYYAVLHFSELKPLLQNESRQFFVYLGGTLWNDAKSFTPDYLSSSAVYSTNPTSAPTHYNISLLPQAIPPFHPSSTQRRIEGNRNVCFNATSCGAKRKKPAPTIIVISCVVPVVLLLMLVVLCILRKQQARGRHMRGSKEYAFQIDNRRFAYTELKKITKNFGRVLGKGGFGTVYYGHLDNSIKVAVKMLPHTSSEEFVTEAQHLSRVHHRNLVSMIGYCIDGKHLALVYEYMSQGTLKEHLRGSTYTLRFMPHYYVRRHILINSAKKTISYLHSWIDLSVESLTTRRVILAESRGDRPLSWEQRLRIALEASQGLEYLHTGCKPPLIHRDVKTANILLNERLEAKISDFGLSKAFEDDDHSHVSTKVAGTPGYLDPEYSVKNQLSEKSDVYSFGVVLLELITGQPPILIGSEKIHIVEWVYERLAKGNVEDVVDKSLQGEYDVNCAWKIAYVALNCAMQSSAKRPTMTEVVMQLKERLALQSNLDKTQLEDRNTQKLLIEHGEMYQMSPFEIECATISDKDGPSAR
ncbi:receptor-like protein kinase [Musa troglodytarum]|uniref:Receptor-like protein kinase n=1 Tax=Musa troglodytarum TaxID=320322 RepID=A0A9E7GE14_9LILI|nr:receptor-like protein kinase [Musa troglodytarum]